MDTQAGNKLDFSSLDGGKLLRVFRKFAPHCGCANFRILLAAVCEHSDSDRWELPNLKRLAELLGVPWEEAPELAALEWEPQDGALVMSAKGHVVAAAAQLRHHGRYQIRR